MTAFLLHTVAFVVAIEVARRIAIRRGYLSHPNPIVASHRSPVAYLGGTGLGIAFLMLLGLHWSTAPHLIDRSVAARATAAFAFIALGTWDDLHPLRARDKFLAQVAIAAAYLAASGASMTHAGDWLSLFVLMTLINAYNLVDVLDGLLTVLAAIAVTALLLLPATGRGPAVDLELRLAIAGLAAIFLFNCPPARIYHGDAGSLTLGFLIGAWGLERAAGRPLG
jgi:UDP-GlcNAc:undecaprenyl-phosphate GlcNAc-1-phosphate transferase